LAEIAFLFDQFLQAFVIRLVLVSFTLVFKNGFEHYLIVVDGADHSLRVNVNDIHFQALGLDAQAVEGFALEAVEHEAYNLFLMEQIPYVYDLYSLVIILGFS